MDVNMLPHVQATMNTLSAILLFTGYRFIKAGNETAHMKCMIAALCTSAIFLASYLTYHAQIGTYEFIGQGWIRPVYFGILIGHTILSLIMLPMIIITVFNAIKKRTDKHKKIAKFTLPIWLVVSVSGVVIYIMLYHMYPHPVAPVV